MVLILVCCPHCNSDQVVKCGTNAAGKQRYRCQNEVCSHRTFIQDYSYRAYLPEFKKQMIDMVINGSGVRDTGRVLGVCGERHGGSGVEKKHLSTNRLTKHS